MGASPQPSGRDAARSLTLALLGSNTFSLFVGGIFEYLSLRGIINVTAAWVVLVFVWIIGVLGIVLSEIVWGARMQHKLIVGVGAAMGLGVLLWGLDQAVSVLTGASVLNPRMTVAKVTISPPLPSLPRSLTDPIARPKPLLFSAPSKPSPSGSQERVVLPMTYFEFEKLFEGKTQAQIQALEPIYEGKWITISGTVDDVTNKQPNGAYLISIDFGKRHSIPLGGMTAFFNSDISYLSKGQKISALCQFYGKDKFGVRYPFSNCELVASK